MTPLPFSQLGMKVCRRGMRIVARGDRFGLPVAHTNSKGVNTPRLYVHITLPYFARLWAAAGAGITV